MMVKYLSGEYAPRSRIYNVESLDRGDANSLIKPISQTMELRPDIITIDETLRKAGYLTAHFGKCGLGSVFGRIRAIANPNQ